MITFADLTLEQVILEVKFAQAFLYWDVCGSICREISQKWPDLSLKAIDAQSATRKLGKGKVTLSFGPERLGSDQFFPEDVDNFRKITSDSATTILSYLKVSELTRIGNKIYLFLAAWLDTRESGRIFRESESPSPSRYECPRQENQNGGNSVRR